MSKMKIKGFFSNFKLSTKITLFYGSVFSIAVIILSAFVFKNAAAISRNIAEEEIFYAEKNIRKVILEEDFENLSSDDFSKIKNDNISAIITNKDTEKTIKFESEDGINVFEKAYPMNENPELNNLDENLIIMPQSIIVEKEPTQDNSISIRMFDKPNFMVHEIDGDKYIFSKTDMNIGDDDYIVLISKKMIDSRIYMNRFMITLLIIDFVGILLSFLIGKYISGLMLKPVRKIMATAEVISGNDLSKRIDISGPDDEMKELSVTFNKMIERLEESFEKQNRFVSDASHELRTPISVIQGYAKLIDRWGKDDPKVLKESIDSIIFETEHMSSLTKKLLFLAKSDQSLIEVHKENFCLNKLIEETMREAELIDGKRKFLMDTEKEITLYGDESLIKQLLWIFTENAIKYTSEEKGKILYKAYEDDKNIYLSVKDNGIGISEENIKYIFDRFYRVDESRNKSLGGTGLGLSIAKWIVSVHEAEIDVLSEPGKETEFIVKFSKN